MKKVLIGGIGNVLLGDDGVGPYVVRLLTANYEFDEGVELCDLGTPALDLIDQISGKDAVILIDALKVDTEPGSVLRYRKPDIVEHSPAVRMDPHSPALVETLLSVDMFGIAPADVLLVGISSGSYDCGCCLSNPVQDSIDRVIAEVLAELDRIGVRYYLREHPIDSGIWWTSTEQVPARL
ncbi:MAG TPA: hydrogenase maturation protease [Terriglobales bacterium]|nr:hydrogenase maturation protease [Terriglobales bacterium]